MGLTYSNDKGELINYESITEKDILIIMLQKLINEYKFNEAENILFEKVEENPNDEIKSVAEWFYNSLSNKSDTDLECGNFSREEILQGKLDIKSMFS